ncbi:MAG: hypothetical protein WB440_07155 [Steroidobacteraceae bacterium]|jgi:hypothetical protein
MVGLPPLLSFILGAMASALGYGPTKRWLATLRRVLGGSAPRDAQREDSLKLLLMFVTLHPVPWFFILGVPFAIYQFLFGPLHTMWLWLIAGVLVGAVLIYLYENKIAGRSST